MMFTFYHSSMTDTMFTCLLINWLKIDFIHYILGIVQIFNTPDDLAFSPLIKVKFMSVESSNSDCRLLIIVSLIYVNIPYSGSQPPTD